MSYTAVKELRTVDGTKSIQVADIADGNVGIGVGQTWQNVTGSRLIDTTYTNDTGRPIMMYVRCIILATEEALLQVTVDSIMFSDTSGIYGGNEYPNLTVLIPPNSSYIVSMVGAGSINQWFELREGA